MGHDMALQADLWYNKPINIVLPSRCGKQPRAWINLRWRLTMDTLPPHAQNDKSSNHIPATPGIYRITCIANNRIYVGSTANLHKRQLDHFSYLRRNKHQNPYLQRAWNKYGEQAFTFEVLELVLVPEMLITREQYWFDKLKPFGNKGFNIAREAGHRVRLGRPHTPEARAKIGLVHIGNKYNLGKVRSPETLEKLRQSHRGKPSTFKGQTHTPESREKIKQARSRQQIKLETIEAMRQANLSREYAFEPNIYRIEGNAAYIELAGGLETIVDISDLEHALKVHWRAQYHKRTESYYARGTLQGKSVFLSRYLTDAEEGERVDHRNNNTLDNRRFNLQIAQITDSYHNRRGSPKSKLGIRGVAVSKQYVTGTLAYNFRCRSCKISKNFPYTEEGLEAAKVFAEAHYAAMERDNT